MRREAAKSNRKVERGLRLEAHCRHSCHRPLVVWHSALLLCFSEQKAQTMRMSSLRQRRDAFSQLDSGQRARGMWWSCYSQPHSAEARTGCKQRQAQVCIHSRNWTGDRGGHVRTLTVLMKCELFSKECGGRRRDMKVRDEFEMPRES